MRIDSHQHFWQYERERHAWITDAMAPLQRDYMPADLSPVLAANHIDATIAVQVDQSEEDTQFLLDLATVSPFIAGVVGWIDLRAKDLPHRLEHCSQFLKLRGFRHIAQSEPDDVFLAGDTIVNGIRELGQYNFTYDILIYPRQLLAALTLTSRLPGQLFVIDHIAKPLVKAREMEPWATTMRDIAANPSVFCKVSGLITEADWQTWKPDDFRPYLDVVFEAFGPDRLMFGSDWPVCLLAGTYQQVVQLIAEYVKPLTTADQEKIFGLNAGRFYGVKAAAA